MTETAINWDLKRINEKIKYLESCIADTTQTGSLVMQEMAEQARKEILREFSIIQQERDNAVAALKDNLKNHLAPYSKEDIQKIREEKMQLVTAAEFKAVHRQMLEQNTELEKKLSISIKTLEELITAQEQLYTHTNNRGALDKVIEKSKNILLELGEDR